MSDRPRFHAEKNHEFIRGRSPDFQAKPFISGFRPSAFPGYTEWLLEDFYRPDYSGGTVPDLNRLPFYVLADTSDRRRNNHNIRLSCDWPLLRLLFCREEGSHLFPRRHELRTFHLFSMQYVLRILCFGAIIDGRPAATSGLTTQRSIAARRRIFSAAQLARSRSGSSDWAIASSNDKAATSPCHANILIARS
jgi:hypothetical protein